MKRLIFFLLVGIISINNSWGQSKNEYITLQKEVDSLQIKLTKAKERLLELEQEFLTEEEIFKNISIETDDITGYTWYKSSVLKHDVNQNKISLILREDENSLSLFLKCSCSGKDYIFFDTVYLNYDGNTEIFKLNSWEVETECTGYSTWEWTYLSISTYSYFRVYEYGQDTRTFIQKMVNGESVKIRLSGKYSTTREVSKEEIQAMKDILNVYLYLMDGI